MHKSVHFRLPVAIAAILLALQEEEDRLTVKVKLAVREAVEDMLSGEMQALKTMMTPSTQQLPDWARISFIKSRLARCCKGEWMLPQLT